MRSEPTGRLPMALALLALAAGAAALLAPSASAGTAWVDPSFTDDPAAHQWDTVQEGVYDAGPGDTVFVHNGTYYENVTVWNSSVILEGESRDGVVIDLQSAAAMPVIDVRASFVTIRNMTLMRGDNGVRALNAAYHNGTVDNVTIIYVNYEAVEINSASSWTIHDSTMSDCGYRGILILGSASSQHRVWNIAMTTMTSYEGIYLDDVWGSTFANITVQDTGRAGVWIQNSHDVTFDGLLVNATGYYGLYLSSSDNLRFLNASVTNKTGSGRAIDANNVDYGHLENFTITGNTVGGIYLQYSRFWKMRSVTNTNAAEPFEFLYPGAIAYDEYQHDIDMSNTINGRPIVYFSNATGTSYNGSAAFFAAVNSTGLNIAINNTISGFDRGVIVFYTHYSNFTGINASGNSWNFHIEGSVFNNFTGTRMSSVRSGGAGGMLIRYADFNLFNGGLWELPARTHNAVNLVANTGSNNNTFENLTCDGWNVCFHADTGTGDLTIRNVTITDCGTAVYGTYFDSLLVERSTLSNNVNYAISLTTNAPNPTDWVTLRNNTISRVNSNSGIWLDGARNVVIEDNWINDTDYSVYVYRSDHVVVRNNIFNYSRNCGFRGYSTDFVQLLNNSILYGPCAVYWDASSYWTLRSNMIPNMSNAFQHYPNVGDPASYFLHDVDASNLLNGYPVLYVVNATSGAFSGDYSWIAVANSSNVTVTSTRNVSRNVEGFFAFEMNDSVVELTNFTANQWGMRVWESERNTIRDVFIGQNTAGGAYWIDSHWNTFLRDRFRPDTARADYAVNLDGTSHHNTFEEVECNSFSTCLFFEVYTNWQSVLNSTFNDSYYSVYSQGQYGPRVEWNAFNYSVYYGVYISYSTSRPTTAFRLNNNTFNSSTYDSIYCYACRGGVIEDSVMRNGDSAVRMYQSDSTVVARNTILNMQDYGIIGEYTDFAVMLDNVIANGSATTAGFYFSYSRWWTLRGNNVSNPNRPVMYSFPVPMTNAGEHMNHDADATNTFGGLPWRWFVNATAVSFSGTAGLVILTNSTALNVTVTNPMSRNYGGFMLFAASGNTLYGTNVSANEWGGLLYNSHNNTLLDLTVWRNTLGGVYLTHSDWNRLEGGNYTADTNDADYAVYLDEISRNNTVSVNATDFSAAVYVDYNAHQTRVEGGNYTWGYYGVLSYAYIGLRVVRANFSDTGYTHVYVYGSGLVNAVEAISNNSFHRAAYYGVYIYYTTAGNVSDNVINGTGYDAVYLYYANGVTVARNRVSNISEYAFSGYITNHNRLIDNVVTAARYGVYFYESRYWTFTNNTFSAFALAAPHLAYFNAPNPVTDATLYMHYWTPDNTVNGQPVRYYVNATGVTFNGTAGWLVAVNSTFMDLAATTLMEKHYYAALFVKVFNSTLRGISTNGTYFGAALYWGADNRVVDISVNGSTYGVYLSNNTRATIDRAFVSNSTSYGVFAFAGGRLNITNSTLFRNYYGVYIDSGIQFVNITGNLFDGSPYVQLYSENGDDIRIVGNTLVNTQSYGILVQGSSGDHADRIMVLYNTINDTVSYEPVRLDYGYSGTIEGNLITNSSDAGIMLLNSNANLVRLNTLAFNYYGFYIQGDSNTMVANHVTNSTGWAIYIPAGGDFNRFYHNNFYLANGDVYDQGTSNTYDNGYPAGGNYWSNTTHTDLYRGSTQTTSGPDGINDTSAYLGYGRRDFYPLAEPWPPYMVLVSPANGSVIQAGVPVLFNISNYFNTVQYALNNGSTGNLTSPWNISTSLLADGDLFLQMWANDTWYNISAWYLFVIDSTQPSIVLDAPTAGGTYTAGTQLNFTVTDAHLASNVTVNYGAGNLSFPAPWDISTLGWLDGNYNVTIRAWDTAGNSRTSVFYFEIDSAAPAISLNSPSNNSFISAGTLIDLTVTDAHLSSVTWDNGSGANLLTSPFDISTTGWGSATWSITVTANDTAGFVTTRVFVFTIDAVPPTITLNSPSNNSVFDPGVTLDFAVSDTNLNSSTYNLGAGPVALPAPFDVSTTGWADGAYNVTIVATDTAGNVATVTFHFEVDSLAPSVTVVSPSNGAYIAGGTADFTVADAHLSSATWSNGTGDNALTAPFDVSLAGWSEGPYTITVNATDAVGHTTSRSVSFTIDSTPPSVALLSPANNSYILAGTLLDFAAADTNLATVVSSTGGAYTAFAAPYDISTTGFADGVYTVRINATDLAGNFRNVSFTFTVDSTAPAVTIASPANNSHFAAGRVLDFAVVDANLQGVVSSTGGAYSSLATPYDISTTGLVDGALTVRINATDLAGNFLNISFSFMVDSTVPVVALNSPANNSYFAAGRTLDFSVGDTNLAAVLSSTGGSFSAFASPYDISTTGFADGGLTVRINASDLAGNFVNISFSFTVDSTAPSVTITSPSNNSYFAAGRTLDFAVSDANLQGVVSSTGGSYSALASPYDISTTGFADGGLTVRINASDLAGNFLNISFSFTVDSTQPSVTLNTPSSGSVIRAGVALDFSVSDTNLAAVVSSTGGAYTTLASPYDVSTTGLADGAITVLVNASDLAGNFRNVSFTFTIDSTAPTVTLNSPSANAYFAAGVPLDFAVSDANLATVVSSTGGAYTALASPYDISTGGFADGAITVRVNATDSAGNFQNVSFSFTVDSTLPAITLNGPASGSVIRAGVTLDFSVADTNLGATTWSNGGSYTMVASPFDISTTGWADGSYTVRINATDFAGNFRNNSYTFTLDSTNPSISLTSPAANSTIRAGTIIVMAISDANLVNTTYERFSNNASMGRVAFTVLYQIDTTGWTDGDTVRVHADDAAANARSFNVPLAVDATSPSIVLSSPLNGSVIRAGTPIVWAITDAGLQSAFVDNGTTNVSLGVPFTVNTTGYIDRNYNFAVFAVDAAGNAARAVFNFTIDSTPPQVQLFSPANNSWLQAGVSIDFLVSDLHLAAVNATIDGIAATLLANYDYHSDSLADGTHTFVLNATDAAGNSRALTAVFRVDKTPPTIVATPQDGAFVPAGTPWTFTITEANIQLARWSNQSVIAFSSFAGSYVINTTGWGDGPQAVIVQVFDQAGNTAQLNTTLTFDSTIPQVLVTLPSGTKYIRANAPVVFQVIGEPYGFDYTFKVGGVDAVLVDDGTGALTFTFTAELEGQHDLALTLWDRAGNTFSSTWLLILDNTAPAFQPPFPMAFGGNEDGPFEFHGKAFDAAEDNGDPLFWVWTFDPAFPHPLSLSNITGQDANWTFDTPGLYDIEVSVSDPAGNTNNTTFSITIFDITPPSVTINTTFLSVPEDTPFSISQTSDDNGNGTLNWTWRAPAANLTSNGANITWIFTTPGVYNITLTVRDPSNNTAQGYLIVDVQDITMPNVTIDGPSVSDVLVLVAFRGNATDNDPRYNASNWTFVWRFTHGADVTTKSGQSVTYIDIDSGQVIVELNVTDASGNRAHVSKILTVNKPPVIGTQPPTSAGATDPWVWQPNATDPEQGAVTVVVVSGPPGMTATSDGSIVWTPGAGDIGSTVNVTVAISDGVTTVLRDFSIFVLDPAVVAGNRRPVFESEPPTDASVSKTYLYDIIVTDADGDDITILISGLEGYAFNEATRHLSWVPPWQPSPNEVFERLVPVTITAFDGKQSQSQEFVIRFRNPPNQFPQYRPSWTLGDVVVGREYEIKLNENKLNPRYFDPDDVLGNLTFFLNTSDPAVRTGLSRILEWEVRSTDGQNYSLWFTIKGEGRFDFQMAAKDPSGARSDNADIHVNAMAQPTDSGLPFWMWLLLLGVAAGAGLGLVVAMRRARAATQVAQTALEAAAKAPTERVIIQQAPAAAEKRKDTYVIEGVFVIYQDGRMIFSKTDASEVKLEDPELVASMFSAVQSFIKDSFQQTGELNRLGFGENTILIERGSKVFMAAIIYGEPQPELFDAMKDTIRTIENAYTGIIEEWDGSTTSLEAIDQYVLPFLALTAGRSRADVKAALTEKIVKMLSELEFFQGFVRLKCGVKNDTESVITKVTVSIDFNEDVLRLHHIEPDTYKVQGSETQLGVLNPGEKVSVAYYFDPQICTESQIDGVARYRDSKGAVHSLSMKTRKAEVVCPIFFTKEHANTAMLKRLVEGELEQRDSKVFNVTAMPDKMTYDELFSLVKEVVMAHDVHLVRDFIKEAPYHGEAWFFGETKVKGYKIVIRASVMEEGKRIEFFAASTAIAAITGLLAEFNHTFHSLVGRKFSTLKFESEFDEAVKADIQKKSLMAQMSKDELDAQETDQDP